MADTPNIEQQKCIDKTEGKIFVLAGPGTGKTYTVSKRIKHLLEDKNVPVDKILCLTYTETGADEMRNKILKAMNKTDLPLNVYTYHGFCNEILQNFGEEFALDESTRPITEAASKELLKECIDELKDELTEYIDYTKSYYAPLKTLKEGIVAIKQNRVLNKEDFDKNVDNYIEKRINHLISAIEYKKQGNKPLKGTDENRSESTNLSEIEKLKKEKNKFNQLWIVYSLYKRKMNEAHYIDFNDMINFVLDKFIENPSFLEEIREKYEYILVDEYQDTNPQQNEIVFKLTGDMGEEDNKNVFVVGDDDQIIFSFQGARLDTINKFLDKYPEIKENNNIICLKENHRSTQNILDVSRKIIISDDTRLENNPNYKDIINKKLTSFNKTPNDKKVQCKIYKDIEHEYYDIVSEIDEIKSKVDKLSDIAILTKSNFELKVFSKMLEDKNIPYELKNGRDIFEIKSVQVLYYYISALANPDLYSDRLFKIMLLGCFNIDSKDYFEISKDVSKRKSGIISHIENILKEKKETINNPESLKKFVSDYYELKNISERENIRNTILEIGRITGIFNFYFENFDDVNSYDNILGIKKFIEEAIDFSAIKNSVSLYEFVEYLNMVSNDDELKITIDKKEDSKNAVQLSTYHSSKGREFEIVYMPTLVPSKWESDSRGSMKPKIPLDPKKETIPDYTKASANEIEEFYKQLKISDKKKLMYVGMTRAKKVLKLSYPAPYRTEFLDLLIDDNSKSLYPDIFEVIDLSQKKPEIPLIERKERNYRIQFNPLCDSKFNSKPFSASSLNEYLKCPRMYFYNKILDIDTKSGNADSANYGSAIHQAFEDCINKMLERGDILSQDEMINIVYNELDKLPFSSFDERERYKIKGRKAIENVYKKFELNKKSFYAAEYKLQNAKLEDYDENGILIDTYNFTGFIDRIDINEDSYTIYDYKTGKYKTDIKLSGGHEDYYNQIALYRYFLEKLTGKKVNKTIFLFPDDSGSSKIPTPFEFELKLTEDEVEAVKNKFIKAIRSIKNYEFDPIADRNINKAPCSYCAHKIFCGLDVL